MNDSSQSTILSRRDYIISERNNNRFRFSFGLCTQECVIQKIIEYLLQNQKSANSHQHLSMNTPHKCNHYYLCYLDIPRSVVTYTSNIFFLELSVLVTLQHIEIPFFIVLFFVGNNQINTLVLQLLYLQSVQIWFGIAEISISMTAVCVKLNFPIKGIKKLQNSL